MRIIRDDFVDFGTGLSGLALTNEELSELHFGARIGVVAGDAPPHRDRRLRFTDGAERLGERHHAVAVVMFRILSDDTFE